MKASVVERLVSILVGQETIDSFFTFILLELEFRTSTYTLCSHYIMAGWTYHRPTLSLRNVTAIQIYICIENNSRVCVSVFCNM